MARRDAPARKAAEAAASGAAPADTQNPQTSAPGTTDATPETAELSQEEIERELERLDAEDAAAEVKATAATVPAAAADVYAEVISDDVAGILKIRTPAQRRLLAEACYVFGIDPDPRHRPVELAGAKFDAGDPMGPTPTPPSVSIVTAGGLKIRYPIDDDTEHRLRNVYGAYRIDKKTQTRTDLPLPPDLTLPREHIDGQVRNREHQYRTGYLRDGDEGRRRKVALDELRRKGTLR